MREARLADNPQRTLEDKGARMQIDNLLHPSIISAQVRIISTWPKNTDAKRTKLMEERSTMAENVLAPGWLTTDDAAELVDYTSAHVRGLAMAGRIEAQKLQGVWIVNKRSLLNYKKQVKPGRPRERERR